MTESCDKKRCLVTIVVVALVYAGLDYLLWDRVLGNMLQANIALWRPTADMQSKMWVAYVGYLVFAALFTCIYGHGVDCGKCTKQQGIRYGLLIGLLVWGAGSMLQYPYVPMTDNLYWATFVGGVIEYIILGLIVGVMHQKDTACTDTKSSGQCCS